METTTTDKLINAAQDALDFLTGKLDIPQAEMEKRLRDALVKARDLYLQDIKDCGPCDHSVNICVCGLIHEAEQIDKLLAAYK